MRYVCSFVFVFLVLCAPLLASAQDQSNAAVTQKVGPPFALREEKGTWWLVTPEGKPFFSVGVCCVTPGDTWLDYNPKNPGYAAWQQYLNARAWADTTVGRLKAWGFTTVGGWSDDAALKRSAKMDLPYTLVLHLGSSSGAPWWDMWDPKVIDVMDEVAKKAILPVRDDPHLLGYYTDNEMGWWNAALFKMTLEQKPTSGQRRRAVRILRDAYHSDWSRLLKDFISDGADSFDALDRRGVLYLRPGGDGIRPLKQVVGMIADRYYALVRQIVRKYDPRGLLLGDRYQSFYYPEVAQAARPYVDAVSTNLNANWNDGTFVRFYLDTLYALTQKPIAVGEFYMTATENRSGNKNDASGFPVTATQAERAAGFRTTLERLERTPYVVGADWFQFYDEPTFGRGDGENYDMGLVDIHDQPYADLITTSAAMAGEHLHSLPAPLRPDAYGGIPPAPKNPTEYTTPADALKNWDRERGFAPPKSPYPIADLTLCWDEKAVYVGLYAYDIVEDGYYKDKRIPESDRAEWTLQPGSGKSPITIRLGAGRAPNSSNAEVRVFDFSGRSHDVHTVAVAVLPAALFGKEKLRAGDRITFASTLLTFARAYKMEWAGTFPLAE